MSKTNSKAFPILMILFLVIPILEIFLLIKVAGVIDWLPTIALVVLTAVIGASLLRSQGTQTYLRFNQALGEGRMPANEILEGVALIIGGALLLTPGFFTDAIGFVCLLPFTRRPMVKFIINKFNPLANAGAGGFSPNDMGGTKQEPNHRPSSGGRSGDVIEGEVMDRSDERP